MTTTETAERERIAFAAVELARNPARPRALQVIEAAFSEWTELRGDRLFGDDRAVVGGPARLDQRWVMLVGQEKGTDAISRALHNFGMPHPEGYRKEQRLLRIGRHREVHAFLRLLLPGGFLEEPVLGRRIGRAPEEGDHEQIMRGLRGRHLRMHPHLVARLQRRDGADRERLVPARDPHLDARTAQVKRRRVGRLCARGHHGQREAGQTGSEAQRKAQLVPSCSVVNAVIVMRLCDTDVQRCAKGWSCWERSLMTSGMHGLHCSRHGLNGQHSG